MAKMGVILRKWGSDLERDENEDLEREKVKRTKFEAEERRVL